MTRRSNLTLLGLGAVGILLSGCLGVREPAPVQVDAGPARDVAMDGARDAAIDAATRDDANSDAAASSDLNSGADAGPSQPIPAPCSTETQQLPALTGSYSAVRAVGVVPLDGGRFGVLYRTSPSRPIAASDAGMGTPIGGDSLVIQMFETTGAPTQATIADGTIGPETTDFYVVQFGRYRKRSFIFYSGGPIGNSSVWLSEEQISGGRSAFTSARGIGPGILDSVVGAPDGVTLVIRRFTASGAAQLIVMQAEIDGIMQDTFSMQTVSSDVTGNRPITGNLQGIAGVTYEEYSNRPTVVAYGSAPGISTVYQPYPAIFNSPQVVSPHGASEVLRYTRPFGLFSAFSNGGTRWSLSGLVIPYTSSIDPSVLWILALSGRGAVLGATPIRVGSTMGLESTDLQVFPFRVGHEGEQRPFVIRNSVTGQLQSGSVLPSGAVAIHGVLTVAPVGMLPISSLVGLALDTRVMSCNRAAVIVETADHSVHYFATPWDSL